MSRESWKSGVGQPSASQSNPGEPEPGSPFYIEGQPPIDDQRVEGFKDLMKEENAEAAGDLFRECPELFSSDGILVEHEDCRQSDEDSGGDQDF